jgi:hypothetical protein
VKIVLITLSSLTILAFLAFALQAILEDYSNLD